MTCPGPRIAPHKVQHSRLAPPARADSGKEPSEKELQEKFFSAPNKQPGQPAPGSSKQEQQQQGNLLENPLVNPYALGRQARRAFDDVWEQLSSIAQPTKSYVFDEVLDPSLQLEEDPTAAGTKVLVVGATGRVGRILIRKLLLRGYKVCALIRRREGIRETAAEIEGLPSAVEIINGDVGELKDCQRAVKGVNKVRCIIVETHAQEAACCSCCSVLACQAAVLTSQAACASVVMHHPLHELLASFIMQAHVRG